MEKKCSIRIVKEEIKDIEITFPTEITNEELAEWIDGIEEDLFETTDYSLEETEEEIGGKTVDVKTKLQSEHVDYELVDIAEYEE